MCIFFEKLFSGKTDILNMTQHYIAERSLRVDKDFNMYKGAKMNVRKNTSCPKEYSYYEMKSSLS